MLIVSEEIIGSLWRGTEALSNNKLMNKCLLLALSHDNFFIIDHSFLSWRTIIFYLFIFLDPLANYYITQYNRPINLITQVKLPWLKYKMLTV